MAPGLHDLRVQYGAPGRAPYGVVREDEETYVEDRARAKAAHDGAHAAAFVAVVARLRAVPLLANYDRAFGRGGEIQLLRDRCEPRERAGDFVDRGLLLHLERDALRVPVFDRYAVSVGADSELREANPTAFEPA